MRIPIIRKDEDGTVIDGTAEYKRFETGKWTINDFRDLEGNELPLPPKSSFEVDLGGIE